MYFISSAWWGLLCSAWWHMSVARKSRWIFVTTPLWNIWGNLINLPHDVLPFHIFWGLIEIKSAGKLQNTGPLLMQYYSCLLPRCFLGHSAQEGSRGLPEGAKAPGVTKHRNGTEWNGIRRNEPKWTGIDRNDTRMNRNDTVIDRNDTGIDRNDTRMNRDGTGIVRNDTGMNRNDTGIDRNDTGMNRNGTGIDRNYTRMNWNDAGMIPEWYRNEPEWYRNRLEWYRNEPEWYRNGPEWQRNRV